MSINTLDEITTEITALKAKCEQVKGTGCEVYDRITGYYRPVSKWNKGKRQEFDEKKSYIIPEVKDVDELVRRKTEKRKIQSIPASGVQSLDELRAKTA